MKIYLIKSKQKMYNLEKKIIISNKEYLELLANKILTQDIYIKHNLKNFALLSKIVIILASVYKLISVRELHKILSENNIKISQITLLDYISYMLSANLIKKVFRFDLKKENFSTSKAKYLFENTGIRNALYKFQLKKSIINDNLVFEKLEKKGKEIFTGKNGTFDFSFISENSIIHISHNLEKKEVIKEARKMLKIPGNFEKVMIVNSIKEIGLRPSTYLPLKIMEIEDFLEN